MDRPAAYLWALERNGVWPYLAARVDTWAHFSDSFRMALMTNCMIMIMVLAALLTPGGALAQVDQSAMSLRGIPGFVVQVQSTPQLDHRELQAVAELELRRLGIRVLTAEEVPSTPGAAGLLISVALTQAAEAPLAGGMTTIEV